MEIRASRPEFPFKFPPIFEYPAKIFKTPAKIFKTPAKIFKIPTKIFKTPAKIFKTPAKIFKTPAKIFKTPSTHRRRVGGARETLGPYHRGGLLSAEPWGGGEGAAALNPDT